ncbi:hypothetical protein PPL_03777 [Heterostelium album PN500]|uniref:Transmembrane protein n=1 Tax=Heterostelium pallidum (strain ATCC 26659 / Pp 5 / PN500) TaxID=670386 RepID=D3B6M7_HETP5|nr:hypothetical protein PPL_03777 [Heterostelium album PN500]EFA82997.1 hypothetical protein PPL_03777 [Heterostelium album PN500]|eukprot:XP_020435114.1 hypothetical protein PPL_03777 [Heterostelium album PN500]
MDGQPENKQDNTNSQNMNNNPFENNYYQNPPPTYQHFPHQQPYYQQDYRYLPPNQQYVAYAPQSSPPGYILVNEKEIQECEKSTDATFSLCIFIFGFFFPIVWIGGFIYLKSPSRTAKILSIASITLFFLTTIILLIVLLVSIH